MKKLQNVLIALVVAVTGLVSVASASAATQSGNGMKVSPVRTDLVIQPGSSKTVSVFVQNVTNATETLKVVKNDFVASNDETGAPALLLNGQSNDKHGLKQFMTTVPTITVGKGQQKEVKVTITIPKGTAGGGYFGAVRFVPTNGGSANSNVSLSGSVGSLILVSVPGNVTEKLTLVSLDARQGDTPKTVFTSGKNISAVVRFQNEGNIQEQPFGKVLLKKGNKTIGSYEINGGSQPGNVLPDSIRRFSVDLKGVGSFGEYTLEGNFGYGSNGQLLTGKTTFYVIPLPLIIAAIVVILIILFLIFGVPRLVRRHDQKVVRKARGRS